MNCHLCGATALYTDSGLGYCKFHRADAIKAASTRNAELDHARTLSGLEDRQREFDHYSLKRSRAGRVSSFAA